MLDAKRFGTCGRLIRPIVDQPSSCCHQRRGCKDVSAASAILTVTLTISGEGSNRWGPRLQLDQVCCARLDLGRLPSWQSAPNDFPRMESQLCKRCARVERRGFAVGFLHRWFYPFYLVQRGEQPFTLATLSLFGGNRGLGSQNGRIQITLVRLP